jgi:hypothetical protein
MDKEDHGMVNALNRMLAGAFLLLMWSGTALVTYWAMDREPPVRPVESSVINPEVRPGDWLKVKYKMRPEPSPLTPRCKVVIEQLMVSHDDIRARVDDINYTIDPVEEWVGLAAQVPPYFTPGLGHYWAVRAYYCNPLQRFLDWPIQVVGPQVPFTVVE